MYLKRKNKTIIIIIISMRNPVKGTWFVKLHLFLVCQNLPPMNQKVLQRESF